MNTQQTKQNFARTIDQLKNKAWNIAIASTKKEREARVGVFLDNMDALYEEIARMIDEQDM